MAAIIIDDQTYDVAEGQNLLQAILSLGLDLPYFCWHPALDSVGACRQCAVKQYKDEKDTNGRIVMACMTPVTAGARISIKDPASKEFRASITEWLMTNHPHDCPVCDEGGECHLQDMTLMTGHNYRRFRFKKRTFHNQFLGPFINHEMNRCIACYRCVRFYNDYAGGEDFGVQAIHHKVYFGRHADGALENEFSGNLVEVCPTGVFTDKTFKSHFTRKWDLQTAPSICPHCSLGCNIIPGERYGSLRRIRNRYHHDINGYFLCDRGRYGYEFVNSDKRLRAPLVRVQGTTSFETAAKNKVLEDLKSRLQQSDGIIGIGSPRASLESNFALRSLVGADRFIDGMPEAESRCVSKIRRILSEGPAPSSSLYDIESADAVLILGEDLTNTAPRAALSVRQTLRRQMKKDASAVGISEWHDVAVRGHSPSGAGHIFVACPAETKLDDVAAETYHAGPDEIARLGFAVAHELVADSPQVDSLPVEIAGPAKRIAGALKAVHRIAVVAGTSLLNEHIIEAAANVAWALRQLHKESSLCFIVRECNTLGVSMLEGKSLDEAYRMTEQQKIDTLVIVENDLYRRAPRERIDRMLRSVKHVIVIDHHENETTFRAEIVLPAATFAESSGTLINNEGRAQRFFRVFTPEKDVQESWRWMREGMLLASRDGMAQWETLDDVNAALSDAIPVLHAARQAAPHGDFRIDGMKIPRETHRYSGRTAMHADKDVNEPKPREDPDSPFSYSMEGYPAQPPSSLIPFFWSPGWNSIQAANKFQEHVGGPLMGGDPGIRLFHPAKADAQRYFPAAPERTGERRGELLAVPFYHIFGSEELSSLSAGIVESTPDPYIALSGDDALEAGIKPGEKITLIIAEIQLTLPATVRKGLPKGIIGIPAGLEGMPYIELPARGIIQREKNA
jgi:NADH-quinone oxidoreductase subunit G